MARVIIENILDWSFVSKYDVAGLTYLRFKHKSLPFIIEKEEGDDFYILYKVNIMKIEYFMPNFHRIRCGGLQPLTFSEYLKKYMEKYSIKNMDYLTNHILSNNE